MTCSRLTPCSVMLCRIASPYAVSAVWCLCDIVLSPVILNLVWCIMLSCLAMCAMVMRFCRSVSQAGARSSAISCHFVSYPYHRISHLAGDKTRQDELQTQHHNTTPHTCHHIISFRCAQVCHAVMSHIIPSRLISSHLIWCGIVSCHAAVVRCSGYETWYMAHGRGKHITSQTPHRCAHLPRSTAGDKDDITPHRITSHQRR